MRNQGRQIERHAARGLRPVQHGKVFLLAHLFHLGQRQHLVGQGGGAVYRGLYLAQGQQGCEVATQCRLHLGLEHGQRRAQLVGGVAHKAFLVVQQALQALHDLAGGLGERQQLLWQIVVVQGCQLVLIALRQRLAQAAHRADHALHHHQHHQGNHANQHRLALQGVDQYLLGQGVAQL